MNDYLQQSFEKMGLTLTDEQNRKLEDYMNGILRYNEHINLTSITDPEEFIMKHYVDSAVVWGLPEYQHADSVLDLGTGGGFPGIPLAVVSPKKQFVLADSLQKRLKVIDALTEETGITNVETVHGRAEDIGKDPQYREQFDVAVSRAVANLAVLAEYCLPLVKPGGYFLSYKGPDVDEELDQAKKAIKVLGGKTDRVEEVRTEMFDHHIIVIRKVKPSPKKYPRRAGTPSKTPIR